MYKTDTKNEAEVKDDNFPCQIKITTVGGAKEKSPMLLSKY